MQSFINLISNRNTEMTNLSNTNKLQMASPSISGYDCHPRGRHSRCLHGVELTKLLVASKTRRHRPRVVHGLIRVWPSLSDNDVWVVEYVTTQWIVRRSKACNERNQHQKSWACTEDYKSPSQVSKLDVSERNWRYHIFLILVDKDGCCCNTKAPWK